MGSVVALYVVYGVAAVALTGWWARTLYRHGAVILEEAFPERHLMAHAVSSLVVAGFQLLNVGSALLLLRADPPASLLAAIDLLAGKLGGLLLLLAIVHLVTVLVFLGLRRRALRRAAPAPVALPLGAPVPLPTPAPAPPWTQAPAAWSTPTHP